MRPPLLAALLAFPLAAAAQQGREPDRFGPFPYTQVPRLSGAGFGTALATPARSAAEGNPAALPLRSEATLSVQKDTEVSFDEEEARTDASGAEAFLTRTGIEGAATLWPSRAGVAWARGPLRLAAGYARRADGRVTFRARDDTYDHAYRQRSESVALAAAFELPLGPSLRLTPGVRVSGTRLAHENTFVSHYDDVLGKDVEVTREDYRASGASWAVGLVVASPRLPVRLGMSYEAASRLGGTHRNACLSSRQLPGSPPGCYPYTQAAEGRVPARAEASVGGEHGPLSADLTLARVFWQGADDPDDTALRDAFEGSANVRYAVQPGLSVAVGLNQTARAPLESNDGTRLDFFDQDPTRFLLVGATLARGPLVLDAAYVNGSLLSDRGSRHHVGHIGLGYRF